MDSLNLIATFYKQEIQQLKEQLKQANDEIAKFRNEQAAQNEAVEHVEAEIVE